MERRSSRLGRRGPSPTAAASSSYRSLTGVEGLTAHLKAYLCSPGTRIDAAMKRLAAANRGSMVQAVDPVAAKNEFFLEMLAAQTLQAESSGSLLARKPEIDFLLRVAGTTQISRAIREKGAKAGSGFLVVVSAPTEVKGVSGADWKELPRRKLSRGELEKVERAAFLSTLKA